MVGKNVLAVFRLLSLSVLEKKKLAPSAFIPAAYFATVFAMVDFPMPATPSRMYIGVSSPVIQLSIPSRSWTRVPLKQDSISETLDELYAAYAATLRLARFWFWF